MPDTSHDPPGGASGPGTVVPPDLTVFDDPRFEKYQRLKEKLATLPGRRDPEPIRVIEAMRFTGKTRVPRRPKDADGIRDRTPVAQTVSFREIAPALQQLTGVPLTYETVRRWWEAAWPDGHPYERPGALPPGRERTAVRRVHRRTVAATDPPPAVVPPAVFVPPVDVSDTFGHGPDAAAW